MTEIDVRTNQPAVDGQPQRARPRGAATVAKGGRGRRTAGGAPAQFGMDPVLWAAWLYYQEGLTQEEVARRIGVGRTTGARLSVRGARSRADPRWSSARMPCRPSKRPGGCARSTGSPTRWWCRTTAAAGPPLMRVGEGRGHLSPGSYPSGRHPGRRLGAYGARAFERAGRDHGLRALRGPRARRHGRRRRLFGRGLHLQHRAPAGRAGDPPARSGVAQFRPN